MNFMPLATCHQLATIECVADEAVPLRWPLPRQSAGAWQAEHLLALGMLLAGRTVG